MHFRPARYLSFVFTMILAFIGILSLADESIVFAEEIAARSQDAAAAVVDEEDEDGGGAGIDGGQVFLRGDVDANGCVNMADAMMISDRIGKPPDFFPCAAAADVNDDGEINEIDATMLFKYLAGEDAQPPAAPFPVCGLPLNAGILRCEESVCLEVKFIRGDADSDGCVTENDAQHILNTIDAQGEFDCAAAADTNGDGFVTFDDGIYLLNYLNADAAPPPAPFPECDVSKEPFPSCCTFECFDNNCGPGPLFLRGDANGDEGVDLSDAVYTLNFLFLGGRGIACHDAGDTNDSGGIDLSDAIQTLSFIFLGGARPREPYPDCGLDPTEDGMVECEHPCGV